MQDAARRRSDAGILQITDRDILALTWIGEQYAITFEQLRRLLGQHSTTATKATLSVSATRNALQRWQQLGFIEQPRKLRAEHSSYIWLSRKGLSQIGLPYPYYEPKLVLTQKNVEGKLEEVDLTQEGKDHAKDPTNLYERI